MRILGRKDEWKGGWDQIEAWSCGTYVDIEHHADEIGQCEAIWRLLPVFESSEAHMSLDIQSTQCFHTAVQVLILC